MFKAFCSARTCWSICQVTYEKILWLSLLERQRQYLPIPQDILHQEDPHLPNDTSSLLESIVRKSQSVANDWPIELHDFTSLLYLNSSEPPTWPMLKHGFPISFRDISFSDCSHFRNHFSETDTYTLTVTFFPYDIIQGLFQYVVQLTLPFEPPTLPPSLEVTLMGVCPLRCLTAPLHPQATTMIPSFSTDGNTDRFVIAHAMGPQGMRGTWIGWKRSNRLLEILVWNKQPPLTGDMKSSIPVRIEPRVVYSVIFYSARGVINLSKCLPPELFCQELNA